MKLFVVFSYYDFTEYDEEEFTRCEDYDEDDRETIIVGVFDKKSKAQSCVEHLRDCAIEWVKSTDGVDDDEADEVVENYFDENVGIREVNLNEEYFEFPELDDDDDEVWEDEE